MQKIISIRPTEERGRKLEGLIRIEKTGKSVLIRRIPDTGINEELKTCTGVFQGFDLIMSNHSFEHISDQLETLLKISKLLSENGVCPLRIPVKTKYIWNRYDVNWVQIDAPRHFFLHTLKSFELLVEKSGLIIQDVIFDSTEFQFWGSEQYKRDIPLKAEDSYSVNPKKNIFTEKQIREFRKMAKELNKNKQGDQAGFYLTREK